MDVVVKITFMTILGELLKGLQLFVDFEKFCAQDCSAMLSLDDLDDQVVEFLVALGRSLLGVKFFSCCSRWEPQRRLTSPASRTSWICPTRNNQLQRYCFESGLADFGLDHFLWRRDARGRKSTCQRSKTSCRMQWSSSLKVHESKGAPVSEATFDLLGDLTLMFCLARRVLDFVDQSHGPRLESSLISVLVSHAKAVLQEQPEHVSVGLLWSAAEGVPSRASHRTTALLWNG